MEKIEYDITLHSTESLNKLVYFCTESGQCSIDDVPDSQIGTLQKLLNERGSEGWELIQTFFGKDSIMAIWKRGAA